MNFAGSLGPRPRALEVQDLASFDRLVADGAVNLHGWHAQSLDL
ncbi:MAG TPA: Rossmann fold nucleotide-binding protein, partial [Arthrobacter sp.]|nr:Rossmann fold nucleotide-binding protein [Arthrobacter sp.]